MWRGLARGTTTFDGRKSAPEDNTDRQTGKPGTHATVCLLMIVYCLLLTTAGCLVFTAYYFLLTAYCLLLTAYCLLLLTVYCLLLLLAAYCSGCIVTRSLILRSLAGLGARCVSFLPEIYLYPPRQTCKFWPHQAFCWPRLLAARSFVGFTRATPPSRTYPPGMPLDETEMEAELCDEEAEAELMRHEEEARRAAEAEVRAKAEAQAQAKAKTAAARAEAKPPLDAHDALHWSAAKGNATSASASASSASASAPPPSPVSAAVTAATTNTTTTTATTTATATTITTTTR